MAKNIVVCCDGTANEFARDRTNVIKLFQALVKNPAVQACYYHPGVGTMAAPGFVTKLGAKTAETAGLAFGYGMTDDIVDLYVYLAKTFEPGDRLFLFGFSRGAYCVRVLTALLYMYGLIPRGDDRLAPYAVRMLWAIQGLRAKARQDADAQAHIDEYFRLAAEFKATFSRECKPHFVGVWDTVSSVGWVSSPVAVPYTANSPDIAIARQAIAIDEQRAFFRTNRWIPAAPPEPSGPKDLQQVWFPGAHCDIGGGYAEAESGLSKIALQWMIDEACGAGLVLDGPTVDLVMGKLGQGYAAPNPDATLHQSLTRLWRIAEYVPKPHWDEATRTTTWRANRFRRRTWPFKPWVHDCAWARDGGRYASTLPKDAIALSVAKQSLTPKTPHP